MNEIGAKKFIAGMGLLSRGGWNPWAVFTHACLETGKFQKIVGEYNYWGLKAPAWWHGRRVNIPTHEYISGVNILTNDCFMDFTDMAHAFRVYSKRIARLYPNAFQNRSNPILFFQGLVSGKFGFKWATDPEYVNKLSACYLTLYDNKENRKLLFPRLREFHEAVHHTYLEEEK